jgi:hypothetical protein
MTLSMSGCGATSSVDIAMLRSSRLDFISRQCTGSRSFNQIEFLDITPGRVARVPSCDNSRLHASIAADPPSQRAMRDFHDCRRVMLFTCGCGCPTTAIVSQCATYIQ